MAAIIATGIANFRRHLPLCGWLYLLKLVLALVITLPLLAMTDATLSGSALGRKLSQSWSAEVISELILTSESLLPSFLLFTLTVALAAFFVKQFLNGGIYSTLLSDNPHAARVFFANAAEHWRGNLRISLLMAAVYLSLAIASQVTAALFPGDIFGYFGTAAFLNLLPRWAGLYLFLILGSILSDLMRLNLARDAEIRVWVNLKTSLTFYRGNFVRLLTVYYLYFLPLVGIWLLIEKLALIVTGGLGNMAGVFLELVLFQLCSGLRTGQSLIFTATAAPMLRNSASEQSLPVSGEVAGD